MGLTASSNPGCVFCALRQLWNGLFESELGGFIELTELLEEETRTSGGWSKVQSTELGFSSLAACEKSVVSCEQNIVSCRQLGPLPPRFTSNCLLNQ